MKKQIPKADYNFEVSYEICNKVGGIYRVLESKAANMVDIYGKNYYLIGPYYIDKNRGEFKDEVPDEKLKEVFDALAKEGIKCHYGRWMVGGKPKTILIDYEDYLPKQNEIKRELWESFGIDSLNAGNMFNRPVVWSWAVGKLLKKLEKKIIEKEEKVVVHFHEWLTAAGLLHLKLERSKIGTVFTTHATSLGRALAYNSVNFYIKIHEIDPTKSAYEMGVHSKHQLEKRAAEKADIFTTVSEITAMEAEKFLGRKPDVILSNGLDLKKFLSFEEIVMKHRLQRGRLREFVISFFFPYYSFDIENTLFYFIIGRNEYKAKGVDIFIESLANLNQKLKEDPDNNKTIVAFFWIPSKIRSVKTELIENKEHFNDIKDSLEGAMPEIEEKILYNLIYGEGITTKKIINQNYLFEIEKKLLRLKRDGNPPIATHELANKDDQTYQALHNYGLTNKKEDPVKVIYYPIYLTGHDVLSGLSYQEALEACHLGVFPSFYEPWGYTPLEAAALGVSSVTTDLAGFGRYRQTLEEKKDKEGVYVLKRYKKADKEVTSDLTRFMYQFSKFDRTQRVNNKIEAKKIAAKADWKDFVKNYVKAHNQSLQ